MRTRGLRIAALAAALVALAAWLSWTALDATRGAGPDGGPSGADGATAPEEEGDVPGRTPRGRARAGPGGSSDVDAAELDAGALPRITGVVFGGNSAAVAGAEVRAFARRAARPSASGLDLRELGEPVATTTSGVDGAFAFDLPDAGPWAFLAMADAARSGARVSAAPGVCNLTVRPVRDDVEIRVLAEPHDAPVAGADVWAVGEGDDDSLPTVHARTDASGIARLPLTDDDTVVVAADGYATERRRTGGEPCVVRLRLGYAVAGIVLDPERRPVAGAVLHAGGIGPDADAPWSASRRRWTTGDDGRFRIEGVRDVLPVAVSAPGLPAVDAFLLPGDEDAEIVLAPEPPSAPPPPETPPGAPSYVTVRLVDADGEVVRDALANVEPGTRIGDPAPSAGATRFAVPRRPGSDVRVSFRTTNESRGGSCTIASGPAVTTAEADSAPVEFRLPRRHELTVAVTDPDGAAIPGVATIQLAEQWWFQRLVALRATPTSATFLVDPTQPLVLTAGHPSFVQIRRTLSPDEAAAGRVVIALPPAVTLQGRVVGAGLRPDDGVQIRLRSAGDAASALFLATQADPASRTFEVSGLAPGTWRLEVSWPGEIVSLRRDVVVPEGVRTFSVGDLSLPAVVRVRGVARSDEGRPVGGAVAEFQAGPGSTTRVEAPVRADGTFDLDLPATARGVVLVRKHGFGAGVARVDASSGAAVAVRLAAEGRLDVRARLPATRGASWSWCVRTADGAAEWQAEDECAAAALDWDHRAIWRGLAPGPVVVRFSGAGWALEREVVVVAGATTVVTLGE